MENNVYATVLDMYSLSDSRPKLRKNTISRASYLDFFNNSFDTYKVLCVDGEEGVGVTTTLSLFAKQNGNNCASYFIDGWSRYLLNPQTIVRSLLKQLSYYTNVDLNPQDKELTLANCIFRLNRHSTKKDNYLYFVFDGFSNIPAEYVDVIKNTLAPLFGIPNARFLFSGKKECIELLLPDKTQVKESNILKFQLNDVEGYLKELGLSLGQDDIDAIYELSEKGLARKLAILTEKLQRDGVEKVRQYYFYNENDFYAEDYQWIEEQNDKKLLSLLTLLTFGELPISRTMAMLTLDISEEEMNYQMKKCHKYIEEDDDTILVLRSDDFRKYLRQKLVCYKHIIEMALIRVMEKSTNMTEQFVYLPALYKHVKDKESLVAYLTSSNVQRYLEEQQSQAALNEQCEYGSRACTDNEVHAAASFRFAINRSVSREIEKNELSDSEIEALIAIGDDETAYALTQHVFLMEEQLKCLLIMAQVGQHLSEEMREQIDSRICSLSDAIDFEHLPDKGLELAKLMLPVKMEKALEIIDKVAKVTKDRQQIDRLYAAISISFNDEGKRDDGKSTKADLVSTKITDEGLRKMADAMKGIMNNSTATQVVARMRELPTVSSQLNFLQFWIPEHHKCEDIGEAVQYAVKLVIDSSATSMPKVKYLSQFCKPLPDMKEEHIRAVVSLLDAVVANIKYPTVEYVKLNILVIGALVKYDKVDAHNRLQNLYLEILDLKDKALKAHCDSLLLRSYNELGNIDDVENCLFPAKDFLFQITQDIFEVLEESAYHVKVVEGPIAALVCKERDFVKKIIAKMNTKERQSRAYQLAAIEYVNQTDIRHLDWSYFEFLLKNVTYNLSDRFRPLLDLLNNIIVVKDKDTRLLEMVKKHYNLFEGVERADAKCYIFSSLYVWLTQNFAGEKFNDGSSVEGFIEMVKVDLEKMWDIINIPSLKVDTGYQIAKVLSKISMKNEAREYVSKTAEFRKMQSQLLTSSSCLAAFEESLNLYAHSLGILIRSELCTEDDIEQFKTILEYDDCEGEAITMWSRVALEYYNIGKHDKFDTIMNKYVSRELSDFSDYYQKQIMYNIAPALYMSSHPLFYDRMRKYDDSFLNACIENIARYIETKYPYPEYTSTKEIETSVQLKPKDYEDLLDLMEHTKDDGFIFNYTDKITSLLKNSNLRGISREIKHLLYVKMEDIIEKCLPMKGGISHNGYKIACRAMINCANPERKVEPEKIKLEIGAIPNKADRAFLYALVASYLNKNEERIEFMDLAVKQTEGIDYAFDKLNRFALCLQETILTAPKRKNIVATKVMNMMNGDKNGTYNDYQRMLDLVRDHDEDLADTMMEMVDDDPARMQYRKQLKLRMLSSKRIESARKDLNQIERLNNEEQMRFFDKQMECLIKKKTVPRDYDAMRPILAKIYDNPITEMQNAVVFFMENLYLKNSLNGKYKVLLREMHQAIIYNLNIVLSIASGTKENMERVKRIMNEKKDVNDAMIQVGQADKALEQIVSWYKEHPCDILHIIDPYFHPDDLYVVKALMDINNNLNCSILTNKDNNKHEEESLNELFQKGWNSFSSDLTGRIAVKSCCFDVDKDQPKSPIHDRWWLLYDSEKNCFYGQRMSSPSTMGKRITEISIMESDELESVNKLWTRFFENMVPKVEGKKLRYEETLLR